MRILSAVILVLAEPAPPLTEKERKLILDDGLVPILSFTLEYRQCLMVRDGSPN